MMDRLERGAFLASLRPKPGEDRAFAMMRAAYFWAMRRRHVIGTQERGDHGNRVTTPSMLAHEAMRVARDVCGGTWPAGRDDFKAALTEALAFAKAKAHARLDARPDTYPPFGERGERAHDLARTIARREARSCGYPENRVRVTLDTAMRWRGASHTSVSTSTGGGGWHGNTRPGIDVTVHERWYQRVYLKGLATIEAPKRAPSPRFFVVSAAVDGNHADVEYLWITLSGGYWNRRPRAEIRQARVERVEGVWRLVKPARARASRPRLDVAAE